MKNLLTFLSLTIITALSFSCTLPVSSAHVYTTKQGLFNYKNPTIGDYTESVGIIPTGNMTNLNVDYTGFGFYNSVTEVGNISIHSYFFPNGSTKVATFTNDFIYNDTDNTMEFWFTPNSAIDKVRQFSASTTISGGNNFFKFNTAINYDDEVYTRFLKIDRTSVVIKYTPIAMSKENYTDFYFKANNKGYGSLTLVGYRVSKDGNKTEFGDCNPTTPMQ